MAFGSGASGNLLQLALSSYDECIDGDRGVPDILTVLEGRPDGNVTCMQLFAQDR